MFFFRRGPGSAGDEISQKILELAQPLREGKLGGQQ